MEIVKNIFKFKVRLYTWSWAEVAKFAMSDALRLPPFCFISAAEVSSKTQINFNGSRVRPIPWAFENLTLYRFL